MPSPDQEVRAESKIREGSPNDPCQWDLNAEQIKFGSERSCKIQQCLASTALAGLLVAVTINLQSATTLYFAYPKVC